MRLYTVWYSLISRLQSENLDRSIKVIGNLLEFSSMHVVKAFVQQTQFEESRAD